MLKTILLVDDDNDDRVFFKDALDALAPGILLQTAENGQEALNMLKKNYRPDLIFLDLNMPVMNGYDCLKGIRADQTMNGIPVIIFSTSLQYETADTMYNIGARLYIVKPNSFGELKKILQKVFALNWSETDPLPKENFIFQ